MYYRSELSYWANLRSGLALPYDDSPIEPLPMESCQFLGWSLVNRIGVAPCPLATGNGITALARRGYGFFVYKTIRSQFHHPYPAPNVLTVKDRLGLTPKGEPYAWVKSSQYWWPSASLSNSLGMPSYALADHKHDIAMTRELLHPQQILAVSIYSEATSWHAWTEELSYIGRAAIDAGADAIEINGSCPNTQGWTEISMEYLTNHLSDLVTELRPVPVIVKLGWMNGERLRSLLQFFDQCGVSAVSGINALKAQVLDQTGKAAYGDRLYAGVSGLAVKDKALAFIQRCRHYIDNDQLNLGLIGIGGIVKPYDYNEMVQAGADIALSATGVMFNPELARELSHGIQQTRAYSCPL